MNINLSAIIAEIIPHRNKCGVIIASTALACLLYVKKRQESRGRQQQLCSEDNNNDETMGSFLRDSQTVLKMISESSFSSDIDLSCMSSCQDLSLDSSSCQPFYEELEELYQSYCEDSQVRGWPGNKEFWQLTNISTCEPDYHYYGVTETEEADISYIWEPFS